MKQPVRWRDIDDLLTLVPRTGDVAARTDAESIKAHLRHLLLMERYDAPFHPEVATGLRGLVFENFSPPIKAIAQKVVENQVKQFETRIELLSTDIAFSYQDKSFNVTLQFKIVETNEIVTYTTVLKRLR